MDLFARGYMPAHKHFDLFLPGVKTGQNVCMLGEQHMSEVSNDPGQLFGSYVINRVLTTQLVQRLSWVFATQDRRKERMHTHKNRKWGLMSGTKKHAVSLSPQAGAPYTQVWQSYFHCLIYMPYCSWETQYHKMPNFDRISCKSATFSLNLKMKTVSREKMRVEHFKWWSSISHLFKPKHAKKATPPGARVLSIKVASVQD